MRKEPEPLNELLLQQFPKKDPIELEQITRTVEKWLEQKRKDYEKSVRIITKKCGENAEPKRIAKGYVHCIDNLLHEIDPQNHPLIT
jgi:hypothetical protein